MGAPKDRLRDWLAGRCPHDNITRPMNSYIRCLDCGMWRYFDWADLDGDWEHGEPIPVLSQDRYLAWLEMGEHTHPPPIGENNAKFPRS